MFTAYYDTTFLYTFLLFFPASKIFVKTPNFSFFISKSVSFRVHNDETISPIPGLFYIDSVQFIENVKKTEEATLPPSQHTGDYFSFSQNILPRRSVASRIFSGGTAPKEMRIQLVMGAPSGKNFSPAT